MRPHRAPRQELCSEGQISQTDEVSHKLPQGRPRRQSKCPGLWVGSHWQPLYSTNPTLCLTKAALVEVMMCRGMSRRGDIIDPRHAGPRACAIGRFRRHFDAGPMPCRTRLSVAGEEGFEGAGKWRPAEKSRAEPASCIAEALLATALGLLAAIPAVMIYNVLARSTTHYRARIGDASAQVMKLVSRDLDRAKFPLPQAAFNDKGPSAAHHSGRVRVTEH
jgi:hypothetical protein